MSTRNSNIEVLRIIAMVMVLSLHSFLWNLASGSDGYIHEFSLGVCFDYFRESLCICAVNVFVLISGYYGIKWKLKSFLNFVFQVCFWSLGLYLMLLLFGKVSYSNSELFYRFVGVIGNYWFVEAYLGLYLLSPILNLWLDRTPRRSVLVLTLLFILFEVVSELLGLKRNFVRGYNTLAFCGIYMIGKLLYLYKDKLSTYLSISTLKRTLLYVLFALIITSISLYKLFVKGNDYMTIQLSFNYAYSNPLVIIEGILLFLVFIPLKFDNKYVNFFACSNFSVYLFHMHPNIQDRYYLICGQLYDRPFLFHLLALIGLFCGIVLFAVLVDKIRMRFFEWIYPKCEIFFVKLWNTRG